MSTSENLPFKNDQLNETELIEHPLRDPLRTTHLPPLGYKPSRIIRRECESH